MRSRNLATRQSENKRAFGQFTKRETTLEGHIVNDDDTLLEPTANKLEATATIKEHVALVE